MIFLKFKGIISRILIITLLLTFVGSPFYVENDASQLYFGHKIAMADISDELADEKKKQEEMEAELKDTNKFLNSLQNKLDSAEDYIRELDKQMNKLADNIDKLESEIIVKRQNIEDTREKLEDSKKAITDRYDNMKLRIQYMYENGNTELVWLFLSSNSVAEFLNKTEYINKITEYDREMLEELRSAKDEIEATEKKLERELMVLEDTLLEVNEEITAIDKLAAAKNEEVNLFEDDIAETEEEIKALKEEMEAQEALVKELEKIEEERKKAEAAGNLKVTYDGGQLIWPLKGYSRISSKFGLRTHPVTGEKQSQHNGIDIPAPTGTPIYACYDGEVAWSYYHETAGNWVGIDHGNGLYTVYMHMSKVLVKKGDVIKKGKIVGKVGSTGRSKGAHLHLGIRVNGKYVDPLTYVNSAITK